MATRTRIHKNIEDQLPVWNRIKVLDRQGVRIALIADEVKLTPSAVYRIIKSRIPEAERNGWL